MICKSAAFLLKNDVSTGADYRPLMLQEVMFCPVLAWVGAELERAGIRRFFCACEEQWAEAVKKCFAEDAEVVIVPLEGCEEAMREFFGGEGGMSFAEPVLPMGGGFASFSSRAELFQLHMACRDEIVRKHAENGVLVMDPSSTYIDPRVVIGEGTVILPGSVLRGKTTIGCNCEIGPNAMIRDCTVGNGTTVNASQINESTVGDETRIGPYSYLRPGCKLGNHVKLGDFVEVKNSTVGDYVSLSHLTYLGDSDVGERVNFGCGTVTANYDGAKKYRCTIGSGAFIGCNTNMIAPVKVGDGAYVAAGTTLTQDVPSDALVVGRVKQVTKDGWARRHREKNNSKF